MRYVSAMSFHANRQQERVVIKDILVSLGVSKRESSAEKYAISMVAALQAHIASSISPASYCVRSNRARVAIELYGRKFG